MPGKPSPRNLSSETQPETCDENPQLLSGMQQPASVTPGANIKLAQAGSGTPAPSPRDPASGKEGGT
jgi:hypothetical protein